MASGPSVAGWVQIMDLWRGGEKIRAIRLYRNICPDSDLQAAKSEVEIMAKGGLIPASTAVTVTLRDQFAIAALQGFLASATEVREGQILQSATQIAAVSYKLADAMMAERAKGAA